MNHRDSVNSKSARFHDRFLVISYSILVILIATGLVYSWQHQQIRKLRSELTSLKSQISRKQQLSFLAQHGVSGVPLINLSTSSGDYLLKIPGISAEIYLPSYLDLTYHTYSVKGLLYADISSKELAQQSPSCIANSNNDAANGQALGVLIKGQGIGQNKHDQLIIKQYPSYYYAYLQPHNYCLKNANPTSAAILVGQSQLFKSSLLSLQPLSR